MKHIEKYIFWNKIKVLGKNESLFLLSQQNFISYLVKEEITNTLLKITLFFVFDKLIVKC